MTLEIPSNQKLPLNGDYTHEVPWMTSDDHENICFKMVTIPTKFHEQMIVNVIVNANKKS